MDRNREARRAAHMAAHPRRRHRSTSLRDSTDEDGGVEGHEQQQQGGGSRLRDRGVVMKKDRERERTSRSKRRRENRVINNNNNNFNNNHNRDEIGDDSSEESVNDDEDEEDDDDVDAGNNDGFKMLPPAAAVLGNNNIHSNNNNSNMQHQNHHHQQQHNHQQQQQQIQHRKSFPPSAGKVFRSMAAAAPPLPAWKAAADEMIGVSVPRKARSASTKRSHEWVSGVIGTEQSHRQNSTSPAASPAQPVAPHSPPSSNLSVRKKMKANGVVGGPSNNNNNNNNIKPRPPAAPKTSSAKSSSSNPEELEIEIAEVLYGLMTQSQAPSADKKETPQSNDNKPSIVSSPTPNSTSSVVAPKRKRPRQVSENPFGVRNSPPASSSKNETDHQNQATNSSYMDHVPENGGAATPFGFTSLPSNQISETTNRTQPPVEEEGKCVGVVLAKEEAVSSSSLVGLNEGNKVSESVIMTAAAANLKEAVNNSETEAKKEEKFEIDLMAPPPQQRTSQGNDAYVEFSDRKQTSAMETSKIKEDEKVRKKEETISLAEEQKKLKAGTVQETGELSKQAVNQELRIHLEKPNKDVASLVSGSGNRSLHQALKQQLPAKSENHTEKTAQPSSVQMPMSVANWPPIGYVAPLQGVISMDGNTMPSAPIQPIFAHPRPKRCATHCYIARNIHYLQQFMKINPFWPPTSGAAPMFGAKPGNLNLMPSAELHGSIPPAMQDKAQGLHIFPGQATTKDTKPAQATTVPDPAQRKQQILLQQAMPPVTPNNILHGPAFIFPFKQQQAAVAASASVRPGSSKLNTSTSGGLGGASVPASSGTVSAATSAAAPALSFNYPNMSANETQYLAILQNNPYTFPIPAVGAPPNYRGNPHAQAMPLFNGSFYSSQMIHPSQISQASQQAPPSTQAQNHHPTQSQQISQTHQNSSGSTSSSQKHLQAQQRQQQGSGSAVNGSGSGTGGSLHNSYPASHKSRSQQPSQHMNPPRQARHLENEVTGGEDSPSTAESRVSRAAPTMNVYGNNYAMPVHSQNFALMNPQAAMSTAAASGNSHDKKQQAHSQQQGVKKAGAESSLPPQTFAMSFSPMNGTTGTMSSMPQNHANAIFQNVPESFRQSYHSILGMAPSMAHSMQKKDFRVPEEASRPAGHHESPSVDEDRKGSSGLTGKSGQSIAFSRPDIATDASGSSPGMPGTSVIDSSSRNINLGSNNRTSRSPMPTSAANAQAQASHHLHTQFQQQQVSQQAQQEFLQLQKLQQQGGQNINARLKNPPSSNGSAYPDHLITSSSSAIAKFPNSLSSFPLQTSNTSSSPVQSPQWRNSVRGPASSQAPSSLASATTSVKNHQSHQSHQAHQSQQPSSRPHQQLHTQISFGAAGQKLQSTTSSQLQQQNQNQNPGTNSSNQSPSPPMLVGSPTTSNISKGGGAGSPRTSAPASTSGRPSQASSLSSSQQVKNPSGTTQRSSPSILGNPHNTISTKSQQQQQQHQKQTMQQQQQQQQQQYQAQAHMFMSHPYMQQSQPPQSQQHSGGSNTASGYYLQQRKQQSSQQQTHQTTSTSMLSLSPPVTSANTTTSDPAKAIAAATSNLKGGVGLPQQWAAAAVAAQAAVGAFPQYAHNATVPVQVKPAEQKQPAGNDNLRTGQPEK